MKDYTLAYKSKLNYEFFLNVNKVGVASFYKKRVKITTKITLKIIEKGKINKTSRRD
jgi:hypothetical protein